MSDNWNDDFMPDDGDFGITLGEAMHDVAAFFLKVLGVVLAAAAVLALLAYGIWRELAIFGFLAGLGAS